MLEEKAAPNDIKNLTTWSEKFISKLASLWSKNGNVLHYFVHYIYSGSFICLAEWQKECKREGNCCPQTKKNKTNLINCIHIYSMHNTYTRQAHMHHKHTLCVHPYIRHAHMHTAYRYTCIQTYHVYMMS